MAREKQRKHDREHALLETVRKARGAYETIQDDVERARTEYYEAVRRLHEAGMPLREISEQLGLSHQRIHQMIAQTGTAPRSKARARAARALGGSGAILLAAIIGAGVWMQATRDEPGPAPTPDVARTTQPDDKFVEFKDCFGGSSDMTITLRKAPSFIIECANGHKSAVKVDYIIRLKDHKNVLRETSRTLRFDPAEPT